MATGTGKWLDETKGFGLIQSDDGGRDVFVHISAVERSGIPARRDRRRAGTVAGRLDQLDEEARHHGAPPTTLAAIKGPRVLLDLSEMPPQGGTQTRAAH